MGASLLASSDRFFRLLLKVYPAAFQDRFAAEMAQVFRMVCQDAYTASGAAGLITLWLPTLWDFAWAAAYQWGIYLFKRKGESMPTNPLDYKDGVSPLPPSLAGLAVLPFTLFGLCSMLGKFDQTTASSLLPSLFPVLNPYLIFEWLVLASLFASLVVGFPRWGYSYLGWAILLGLVWSGISSGSKYSQLSWSVLIGLVLAWLLVRRSLQSLHNLLGGLWQDWTLLSFAVYIFSSFIFMLYDEDHNPYLLLLMTATTFSLSLGAWGYFRAATPLRRILSLVGGLLLAIIISVIDNLTWDFAAYYNLPKGATNIDQFTLVFFIGTALVMFGNGLLAYWRSRRKITVST